MCVQCFTSQGETNRSGFLLLLLNSVRNQTFKGCVLWFHRITCAHISVTPFLKSHYKMIVWMAVDHTWHSCHTTNTLITSKIQLAKNYFDFKFMLMNRKSFVVVGMERDQRNLILSECVNGCSMFQIISEYIYLIQKISEYMWLCPNMLD